MSRRAEAQTEKIMPTKVTNDILIAAIDGFEAQKNSDCGIPAITDWRQRRARGRAGAGRQTAEG
jgi:hypothetical protein